MITIFSHNSNEKYLTKDLKGGYTREDFLTLDIFWMIKDDMVIFQWPLN